MKRRGARAQQRVEKRSTAVRKKRIVFCCASYDMRREGLSSRWDGVSNEQSSHTVENMDQSVVITPARCLAIPMIWGCQFPMSGGVAGIGGTR